MFRRIAPFLGASTLVVAFAATARAVDTLTFTVAPSQPSYLVGEPIDLALSLSLDPLAPAPALVTTFSPGAVRVKRITRNGVVVKPVKTSIDFEEDPNLAHLEALHVLFPASSVPLPFDVFPEGLAASQVVAVRLGRVKHQAKVYTLDGPGSYTVQLLYQFKHPRDPGLPPVPSDVVRRPVRSNVASFVVN